MVTLSRPGLQELDDVTAALCEWQADGLPVQLHPGDLGWNWRFGADATAAAVRTWTRDGSVLAVGMRDSPTLVRLAVAPAAEHDEPLARQMANDLNDPRRGVLPDGEVDVEVRFGEALRGVLRDDGWVAGEPWTPLRRDLTEPVEDPGVRIEVTGPTEAEVRAAVQRAAFDGSTFSAERWHTMAAGPLYRDARCLLAYDAEGNAVATATVWSAGAGRPGLLEPVGVHRDHRGHGHGTAITVAAAAALQQLGASSATVCTASANHGGVATYRAAGFEQLAEVRDLHRSA